MPAAEEGVALTTSVPRDRRGLVEALVGDGRPVLTVAHGPMCGDGPPRARGPA